MNIEQKRKILQKIVTLEADITELKRVRNELLTSGYASATISSGSGSKSYTRLDVTKVTEAISQLIGEIKGLRSLLNGSSVSQPSQVYTIYF